MSELADLEAKRKARAERRDEPPRYVVAHRWRRSMSELADLEAKRKARAERREAVRNGTKKGNGDDTTTTEAPAPAGGPVVEPEPAAETGRGDDGANGAPESRPVALAAAIEHLIAHRGDLLDQRDHLDAQARRVDAELEAVESALAALRSNPDPGDTT